MNNLKLKGEKFFKTEESRWETYSAIGRLRGLAELRGLELGIIRTLERNKH